MGCKICGASQKDRPSIFRNEEFCSDLCRKLLRGEISSEKFEMQSGKRFNHFTEKYDQKSAAKLLAGLKLRKEAV